MTKEGQKRTNLLAAVGHCFAWWSRRAEGPCVHWEPDRGTAGSHRTATPRNNLHLVDDAQLELLQQMFGGCFHEDWGEEHADVESALREVLRVYLGQSSQVAEAIRAVLREGDDAELLRILNWKLGAYYIPPEGARAWLTDVAERFERQARAAE